MAIVKCRTPGCPNDAVLEAGSLMGGLCAQCRGNLVACADNIESVMKCRTPGCPNDAVPEDGALMGGLCAQCRAGSGSGVRDGGCELEPGPYARDDMRLLFQKADTRTLKQVVEGDGASSDHSPEAWGGEQMELFARERETSERFSTFSVSKSRARG